MNEIELILDECLRRMNAEGLTVERLLAQYPEQAPELRPLLESAARLHAASAIRANPGFKAQARGRLLSRVATRPAAPARTLVPAWRLAVGLASLMLVVLASTTAFAQKALPGNALYSWKLESEIVWRNLSPDPVGVDLSLAERRTEELTIVVKDATQYAKARDEFHEVLTRLDAEKDEENTPKINQALQAHQKKLQQEGIRDSKLDEMVKERGPKKK